MAVPLNLYPPTKLKCSRIFCCLKKAGNELTNRSVFVGKYCNKPVKMPTDEL